MKSADLPLTIHKMHFEDPVPVPAGGVRRPHPAGVSGMDVKRDLVSLNSLVGEFPDQMSGDGATVLPACFLRQLLGIGIQFRARDVRVLLEILLPLGESLFDIAAEPVLHGIVSDHIGPAEIRFPLFEHRSEIEKRDVVFSDG